MLLRALFALVVVGAAILIGCADDDTATHVAPEPQERQAAVVEVEQEQERSTERRDAAPTSVTKADTAQETQSNETPANTEPADSEPSAQPETRSIDTAATQSVSSSPPAETGEQSADQQPSVAPSEPEASVSQAQSQVAAAEPEAQSEPEQDAPPEDSNPQEEAEQSHVAQAPATDPEEEQATQSEPKLGSTGIFATQQEGDTEVAFDEQETAGDLQWKQPGRSADDSATQAPTHTWRDGEHTRTITLATELTVVTQSDGRRDIVQGQDANAQSDESPVFRSDTGELMTLPGGVLLAFDATWDQVRINQFFADNGIAPSRVHSHSFDPNGFFIDTEPGLASLNLANQLAAQDGVELSSPNWERRVVPQ